MNSDAPESRTLKQQRDEARIARTQMRERCLLVTTLLELALPALERDANREEAAMALRKQLRGKVGPESDKARLLLAAVREALK